MVYFVYSDYLVLEKVNIFLHSIPQTLIHVRFVTVPSRKVFCEQMHLENAYEVKQSLFIITVKLHGKKLFGGRAFV